MKTRPTFIVIALMFVWVLVVLFVPNLPYMVKMSMLAILVVMYFITDILSPYEE